MRPYFFNTSLPVCLLITFLMTIPFPVQVPNQKTVKALLSPAKEKAYKRFKSVDALFADLND